MDTPTQALATPPQTPPTVILIRTTRVPTAHLLLLKTNIIIASVAALLPAAQAQPIASIATALIQAMTHPQPQQAPTLPIIIIHIIIHMPPTMSILMATLKTQVRKVTTILQARTHYQTA